MGGCGLFILLLPMLIGVGIVFAFFAVALPLYAAFAAVLVAVLVIVYALLAHRGVFERFADEGDWRHYALSAFKWTVRVAIPVLALTAVIAMGFWLYYFHQLQ